MLSRGLYRASGTDVSLTQLAIVVNIQTADWELRTKEGAGGAERKSQRVVSLEGLRRSLESWNQVWKQKVYL